MIPRSRSRSIESRNCSVISRWLSAPVRSIRRSESVVLPWSMWAMIEKLRMLACMDPQRRPVAGAANDYSTSLGRSITTVSRRGEPKKSPRPLLVDAPGRVEAEQAVREHGQELPRLALEALRVGAGHEETHPAVEEGEEELVLRPGLEEVRHLPAALARFGGHVRGVQRGRESEQRLGAGLHEPPQVASEGHPGLRRQALVRALQEDPLRVEEGGVAPLAQLAQGVEQPSRVLLEPVLRLEHGPPRREAPGARPRRANIARACGRDHRLTA